MTKEILRRFPKAQVIMIDHYKDVFCRSRQDNILQQQAQNLILAVKEGNLIYKGAPVCQSFGHRYFYYTSCQMNCLFDCDYCYLKGMYPSGHMVMFVNLDDYFAEASKMLSLHPMYLCISYDADLMAVEEIAGYIEKWQAFAEEHPDLTIEVRTKAAPSSIWRRLKALPNMIYAFTISPQHVIDRWGHGTPSMTQRLSCAAEGLREGFMIRLCFDPMLHFAGWKDSYEMMIRTAAEQMDLNEIHDFSVGTFRMSADYLKKMRRMMPETSIVWYPYVNEDGVCGYDNKRVSMMENYLTERIREYAPKALISRLEAEDDS